MSKLENEMLEELRSLVGPPVPEGAMTFNQMFEILRNDDPTLKRDRVQTILTRLVKEGKWTGRRSGRQWYWWKK